MNCENATFDAKNVHHLYIIPPQGFNKLPIKLKLQSCNFCKWIPNKAFFGVLKSPFLCYKKPISNFVILIIEIILIV